VLNLTADYRFARDWTLFGRVDNLFDKRYATSAPTTRTAGATSSSSRPVRHAPAGWACAISGTRCSSKDKGPYGRCGPFASGLPVLRDDVSGVTQNGHGGLRMLVC